jgi:hypothetical protein
MVLSTTAAYGQSSAPLSPEPLTVPLSPEPLTLEDIIEHMQVPQVSLATGARQPELPDAPSPAVPQSDVITVAQASFRENGTGVPHCNAMRSLHMVYVDPDKPDTLLSACTELVYPYQRFLDDKIVIPLSWEQKGYLALHQWSDPANLMTIAGISAISIAIDSHSDYGPGLKGWGKLTGVSLLQDATGDFFGIFAIPSLTHQDPRYYRMGKGSTIRRIGHAVSQTYVAYGDDGRRMPNYGVLFAYPIASEISNLYVPGIESDGPSTAKRILTGYALEPVNNLVAEFLPDVARRVHVRIIFVQRILNNVSSAGTAP